MTGACSSNRSLAVTMLSLEVDRVAGHVLGSLAVAGVRGVLLKGASVATWLYADGRPRPYRDIDVLVPQNQVEGASTVLSGLGYEPRHPSAAPGEHSNHAREWDKPGWPTVDLHHSLEGARAPASRCWEVLSSRTRPLLVGGVEVEVLETDALACNLVLHAADSGSGRGGSKRTKALDDLSRAIERLDLTTWREVRDIAEELDALAAFGVGLRLDPRGQELAKALQLPQDLTVELVLRGSAETNLALPFERLAAARSLREKAAVVARELLPTPSFVRHWWRPAKRGGHWLIVGYLYRVVWVVLRIPRGLRSWLRARRTVADARSTG